MKKIITCLTVIMLVAVFAVAANAQVKKSAASKALQMQAASGSGSGVKQSGTSIGPKLTLATGDFNGLSIGVESYFFPVESVKGLDLGAEANYKFATNGVSWIQIGGIGKYTLPVDSQAFTPYVGGGLNYNMYSMSMAGFSGSASGIGFKIFGGADYPMPGLGLLYGNVGYANQSFSYTVNIGGWGSITTNANGGGLYLEGGMRFFM